MLEYKTAISKMQDGDCWIWPESDYGHAEIYKLHGVYILFEIPMYGGDPNFSSVEHDAEVVYNIVSRWT